jgi:hemoglobin
MPTNESSNTPQLKPKKDITSPADVKLIIHSFYDKVRKDAVLAPIFEEIVQGNWEPHLEIMCQFWNTMILYTREYKGDPMTKHLPLMLENQHFIKWLALFDATIDELFAGKVANDAKEAAENISRLIRRIKEIPFES